MDAPFVLLATVIGGAAGFSALIYLMYRAVRYGRKSGNNAYALVALVTFFSFGSALDPAREVAAETRKLKREEGDSGDPPIEPDP